MVFTSVCATLMRLVSLGYRIARRRLISLLCWFSCSSLAHLLFPGFSLSTTFVTQRLAPKSVSAFACSLLTPVSIWCNTVSTNSSIARTGAPLLQLPIVNSYVPAAASRMRERQFRLQSRELLACAMRTIRARLCFLLRLKLTRQSHSVPVHAT